MYDYQTCPGLDGKYQRQVMVAAVFTHSLAGTDCTEDPRQLQFHISLGKIPTLGSIFCLMNSKAESAAVLYGTNRFTSASSSTFCGEESN